MSVNRAMTAAEEVPSDARAECPILRTHQRFLLRHLECTQQYAPIYRCRLDEQHDRALASMRDILLHGRRPRRPRWATSRPPFSSRGTAAAAEEAQKHPDGCTTLRDKVKGNEEEEEEDKDKEEEAMQPGGKTAPHDASTKPFHTTAVGSASSCRIIDLEVGVPAVVVGVTYKQMKLLPQFLKEYQKELLRLDAGDGSDDDDALALDDIDMNQKDEASTEDEAPAAAATTTTGEIGDIEAYPYVCGPSDELALEDSSGRVVLRQVHTEEFCTGLVMAVYGTLGPDRSFYVQEYALSGMEDLYVPRRRSGGNGCVAASALVPRPVTTSPSLSSISCPAPAPPPCYIAFISGLQLEVDPDPTAVLRLNLLVDFLSGDAGGEAMRRLASQISRLVIGGNHIALTEEMKLKSKVKLEASDDARLKLNSREAECASSLLMTKRLDDVLVRLCSTVDVELMPGDRDMSNAFLPQQPLHPVLLPKAARFSTLRLVTNPYEFTAMTATISTKKEEAEEEEDDKNNVSVQPGPHSSPPRRPRSDPAVAAVRDGVHFFVSAGQNAHDIARQTGFTSRLEVLSLMVASGCACPTAPNTLWTYPFPYEDPFLFPRCPHVLVACDQPSFETGWMPIRKAAEAKGEEDHQSKKRVVVVDDDDHPNEEDDDDRVRTSRMKEEEGEEEEEEDGVRLVCVPPFCKSGVLVLVDVHSPRLNTITIDFSGTELRRGETLQ